MKVYVAPKAAVLSMNVNENIAASAILPVGARYYYVVKDGRGKVQTSDFEFALPTEGSVTIPMVELLDWITSLTNGYQHAQKDLLAGCMVN